MPDEQSLAAYWKKKKSPGVGEIFVPDRRQKKDREEEHMRLIHSEFGGDIYLLEESREEGKKNPDYLRRDKYWEEQEPTAKSRNSIDKNIQEGIHQIKDKPGGIVLDIGDSEMPTDEIKEIALHRMKRSSQFDCDLVLIRNGKIEEMWRYKKR